MTRRSLLPSLAAGAVSAAAYPCYVEPRWLEVTRHDVILASTSPGPPVRLLHLSDLHASEVVTNEMIDHAIDLGLSQHPDLICITGDFVTHRSGFDVPALARSLRRLSAAAPAFAVLGNHDGGRWASDRRGDHTHTVVERVLEEAGIHLLHNRAVAIEAAGRPLTLAGVGDLWSGETHPERAFAGLEPRGPVVLLSHNPDSKELLGRYPWHLMLCGHTHGGQVIVPFDGPRYAPVRDKRYVAGLRPWGSRQIHVTRGVGNIAGVRLVLLCYKLLWRLRVPLLDRGMVKGRWQ